MQSVPTTRILVFTGARYQPDTLCIKEKIMALKHNQVMEGVEKAPARSLFYAMGYTKEELERPLIAVVSAHS